jgi:hypothetical protein
LEETVGSAVYYAGQDGLYAPLNRIILYAELITAVADKIICLQKQ